MRFVPVRRGSITLSGDVDSYSSTGQSASPVPVIRVLRDVPGAAPASCVDLAGSEDEPGFSFGLSPPATVALGFTGPSPEGAAASAGRCAGPTASDLAPLLPRLRLRPAVLRSPRRVFDLRARRPFTAGGVSGEVISTMVARFERGRPGRRRGGSTGSVGDVVSERPAPTLLAAYRVAKVDGELAVDFRGAADPACGVLDACGVEGSAALSLAGAGGRLVLRGELSPRARGGDDPARWLRQVHRGRVPVFGDMAWRGAATVTGQVTRGGALECRDAAAVEPPQTYASSTGRALRIEVVPAGARTGGDPLRNHCAGPGAGTLVQGRLAIADLPISAVGARRIRATVRAVPGGERSGPYAAARRGALTIELERAFVRVEGHR